MKIYSNILKFYKLVPLLTHTYNAYTCRSP